MLPPFRPALLAFDLDGTLIPEQDRDLSAQTSELLRQLSVAGVQLAAITGRDRVTRRLRQEGRLHATAANNGGLIHVADALLYEETLSAAEVDTLLRHGLPSCPASPYPAALVFSRHGHAVSPDEPVSAEWLAQHGVEYVSAKHREAAYKVLYSHPQAAAHAEHLRATQPHLAVTGGSEPYLNFVSVTPGNATKGTALRRIAAALGVPLEGTVAFGDSDNDADLLEAAGFAVQIGSHPDLTPHADVRLARQADLNGYLSQLLESLQPA